MAWELATVQGVSSHFLVAPQDVYKQLRGSMRGILAGAPFDHVEEHGLGYMYSTAEVRMRMKARRDAQPSWRLQ